MNHWEEVIPEEDRTVMTKAGYGRRQGFGERPAVLVIDVKYGFVGDRPEPILKSIERFPRSCGERGWAAVEKIRDLLATARKCGVPIFYTTGAHRRDGADVGRWARKNTRAVEDETVEGSLGTQIVQEIAPFPEDIVLFKKKPSAFFATPLMSYLTGLKIDTLLLAGTTTSGCVRATAVDAFSYNLNVALVEECVFDRSLISHNVTLFDLNAKYADVVRLETVQRYLETLAPASTRARHEVSGPPR